MRDHEYDTDGDDTPGSTAPPRPFMDDKPATDPHQWPAPRELEIGEDLIPIPERG